MDIGQGVGLVSHLARMRILPTLQWKRTVTSCISSVPATLSRLPSLLSYPRLISPKFTFRMSRRGLLLKNVTRKASVSLEWGNFLCLFSENHIPFNTKWRNTLGYVGFVCCFHYHSFLQIFYYFSPYSPSLWTVAMSLRCKNKTNALIFTEKKQPRTLFLTRCPFLPY